LISSEFPVSSTQKPEKQAVLPEGSKMI